MYIYIHIYIYIYMSNILELLARSWTSNFPVNIRNTHGPENFSHHLGNLLLDNLHLCHGDLSDGFAGLNHGHLNLTDFARTIIQGWNLFSPRGLCPISRSFLYNPFQKVTGGAAAAAVKILEPGRLNPTSAVVDFQLGGGLSPPTAAAETLASECQVLAPPELRRLQ